MILHTALQWLRRNMQENFRLLHSPYLVVIGLSVGYETWPPIGWHHPFVIGSSKYRLGLSSAPLPYGLTWPVGIPTVFRPHWQSFCTALTAGICLPYGLCKGTVKGSRRVFTGKRHPIASLTLTGELRSVYCSNLRENWQWCNGATLCVNELSLHGSVSSSLVTKPLPEQVQMYYQNTMFLDCVKGIDNSVCKMTTILL